MNQPDRGEAARGEIAGCRVAWIDRGGDGAAALASLRARVEADPELTRAARLGGAAFALVPFEACAAGPGLPEPALALSVGHAVARGVPTAARATVTGRAPERSGVTEAQVGGGFARALAAAALDVLVVSGSGPRARVRLRPDAPPSLERIGDAAAAATLFERAAALVAEGECALIVGPGADLGLSFANIASVDGPRDRAPSFVGRGGLGAAFARAGVAAIVAGEDANVVSDPGLTELLHRSPRLAARAAEGTLELGAHRAARDLGTEMRGRSREKHGCRGCPTPCGWVFDLPGGRAVGGRFSALRAALGRADALAFVERCNALGVDAVAAAEVLGGDPPEDLVDVDAAAHRRAVQRRPAGAGGGAEGPDLDVALPGDLAAAVGVRVSPRGPEPLRSLSVFGLHPSAARAAVAPLPWTDGADPAADAGTLARWHECFAAALDIAGFCAFSGAALLADGVATPAELAARIAPAPGGWTGAGRADRTAAAMLAAGAAHLDRHRRLGGGGAAAGASSAAERAPLDRAIAAYWRAAASPFTGGADRRAPEEPVRVGVDPAPSVAPVSVRIRATGFLAERLGGKGHRQLEVVVAASTSADAVRALAAARPEARRWLLGPEGRVLPAVLIAGAAADPGAELRPGDLLELVLLIPGG